MACSSCGKSSCGCTSACSPSLIEQLTGIVDCIRTIPTDLGARPYKVYLVWTQWSRGDRGEGIEEVIREEELTPTPKIAEISNLVQDVSPVGTDEEGGLTVSEISPRYNEHYLMGRADDGSSIPRDQNFYYEIYYPSKIPGVRRRFLPAGSPGYVATKFQWTVRLRKVNEDRQYDGTPRG